MRQTDVDGVSGVFTKTLILSWFILCLRFCSSVEKIGRCRKLCSFYFQSCIISTQAFWKAKKKIFGGVRGVCFLALEAVETEKYLDL